MAQVQLIFSGEVLDGFLAADVRRTLGERLKLDAQRLDKLFAGGPVIIKRGLSAPVANQWVAQFRAMGAKLHVRDEPLALHPVLSGHAPGGPAAEAAPAAAPAQASVASTPPHPLAPVAAAALPAAPGAAGLQLLPIGDPHAAPPPAPIPTTGTPSTERITCPVCGEEQPKRILCRVCAADMPRGIAAKLEEAEAERARRRDEAMARRGVRPSADSRIGRSDSRNGAASRFVSERHLVQSDDEPLFGLSFEGRMGRMRYFLGLLVFLLGLFWGVILLAVLPGLLTGVMLVVGLAFATVWNIRLTVLRLHDVGLTGWWVLASYVPWLGQIACLVLMLWPGDDHDNDHGEPPSQEGAKAAVVALVALSLSVAWGFKTVVTAFERQVQQMQEEAASEDVGLDEDDSGASDATLPAAAELRRVLRSDAAVDEFRRYMGTPGHRAFAISDAGAWGWHGGAARPNQAIDTALAECERRRAPYTPECRAVHLNNDWVMN